MELSLYLARAWGLFCVLLSVGLILNRRRLVQQIKSVSEDYPIALIAGVVALILGAAQITGYNSWTLDYRGLITLLGWLSLVKGAAIISFRSAYLARFSRFLAEGHWYSIALVAVLILGVYLLYVGIAG
jgi:hypothetical protein